MPNISRRGISTRNSRRELINADSTTLNVSISRGMYIFVTRLDLPTIEDMAWSPSGKKSPAGQTYENIKGKMFLVVPKNVVEDQIQHQHHQ